MQEFHKTKSSNTIRLHFGILFARLLLVFNMVSRLHPPHMPELYLLRSTGKIINLMAPILW